MFEGKTVIVTGIGRGKTLGYGIAAAFAAILTAVTTLSLLLYLKVSKSEDVRL